MRRLLIAALATALLLWSADRGLTARADASKSIVVALGQEPDRLYNPGTLAGQLVANLVYDPLVGLDDQLRPRPVLAAQLPTLDNQLAQFVGSGADRHLVVTMPLRQGVTWSDGVPFTASDVAYQWQLMMNPESGFDTRREEKIKSVDRLDDATVAFTYLSAREARAADPERYQDQGEAPVVDPLYSFGLYDAPAIYPSHKLREVIGDDPRHARGLARLNDSSLARQPVGTGPYALSGWDTGSGLTLTSREMALPNRLGQPRIATVTFRVMPDPNAALDALSAGEVQLVTQGLLEPGDSPRLDALPGVQATYVAGSASDQLTFNLDDPLLADPAVRQAIASGLDRQELNDVLLRGKGQVATSQLPAWWWAPDPGTPPYDYAPGQAERLLDQAGWARLPPDGIRAKDGRRLSLQYWSLPSDPHPRLMELVQDQLARIGIELRPELIPAPVLFDAEPSAPRALVARQFGLAEFAWISGYDPAADLAYSMHSRSVPSPANGFRGGNYGDFRNDRVDELLDEARRTLDPGARRDIVAQADAVWQTELPAVPLLVRPITTAASDQLANFRPTAAPCGETWNAEEWDLPPAASS